MHYSKSTGGFYTKDIHGDSMPTGAIEISDEEHAALMNGQSLGKVIDADPEGVPFLRDPTPLTIEQIQSNQKESIKAERDRRTQHGGYRVGSHWFHSDTFSRTQQVGLVMLGSALPANVQWKTMSGAKVQMTQQLAQQIFGAAAASDIAVFAAAEAHVSAMLASVDPASYDLSSGWPPAFGE